MGDEVKKVEKHWFIICKQQQKIEANYSSATNAGNEEINFESPWSSSTSPSLERGQAAPLPPGNKLMKIGVQKRYMRRLPAEFLLEYLVSGRISGICRIPDIRFSVFTGNPVSG